MHLNDHIEEMAAKAAGNWQRFESFAWHERPDDAEDWAIVYTNNRDSTLLDESNASAVAKLMAPYLEGDDPDAISEHHRHWACGWMDGYAIRVKRNGEITPAFREWCEIQLALENYPCLDESDYSQREYDATIENIQNEGRRLFEGEEPDGWAGKVFRWFWENDQSAVESVDDQGGYPRRDAIEKALRGLGLLTDEDEDS